MIVKSHAVYVQYSEKQWENLLKCSILNITKISVFCIQKYLYSVFKNICILYSKISVFCIQKYLYSVFKNICILYSKISVFCIQKYLYSVFKNICILYSKISVFCIQKYLYSVFKNICILPWKLHQILLPADNLLHVLLFVTHKSYIGRLGKCLLQRTLGLSRRFYEL